MRKALSADTALAAEAVMLDIYRRMPARRKAAVVCDAITTGRVLALAGLRARYPQESEARLRRRLLGLVLGETVATEVYGRLEDTP